MNLVCFDTMIIIWGIQGWASESQQDMIVKARSAIKDCSENDIQILVPSIALAEILSGIDSSVRQNFSDIVHKDFMVAPFDGSAAIEYANCWSKERRKEIKNNLDEREIRISRNELKADLMIISIAKSRKVDFIYSEDEKLIACAKGIIDVRKLPSVAEQTTLPEIF